MIYREFQDLRLSALGMGCMRLPTNGSDAEIDKTAAARMLAYAMEKGINYYDTAWGYHNGQSEPVMGELLAAYPRESFYLATKFPGYDLANLPRVREIFPKQLERLRTDYVDFYLFHNVCEANIDGYLDPALGIYDYLMEEKAAGRIRHLGFSTHGTLATMKRFLDAYGRDMEFCQLQINWLDWDFQNAREKVKLVASYGIPVWVMEPVRGGALASLDEFYMEKLRALRSDATAAEWAFRFIQSIPEVTVTLSGMSNFEQLVENIATYEKENPLSGKEQATLFAIAAAMTSRKILPCTACRYCTAYCPQGLDIPRIIELYNEHIYSGGGFIAPMAMGVTPKDKQPAACLSCHVCESVCPQNIKISEMMADFAEKLS